jgi:2-polyprenyl-6-methoxyphenol hydroxylase-like FAD-dependent oxidoreductase
MTTATADVLIVGGGPAGVMAGLLFARAGVSVRVLKSTPTSSAISAATRCTLDDGDPRPARDARAVPAAAARPGLRAQGRIAGRDYTIGDLSHLNTPAPFIAMMPQWEFLDFLRDEAEVYPGFALEMEAEATGFLNERGPHHRGAAGGRARTAMPASWC